MAFIDGGERDNGARGAAPGQLPPGASVFPARLCHRVREPLAKSSGR